MSLPRPQTRRSTTYMYSQKRLRMYPKSVHPMHRSYNMSTRRDMRLEKRVQFHTLRLTNSRRPKPRRRLCGPEENRYRCMHRCKRVTCVPRGGTDLSAASMGRCFVRCIWKLCDGGTHGYVGGTWNDDEILLSQGCMCRKANVCE